MRTAERDAVSTEALTASHDYDIAKHEFANVQELLSRKSEEVHALAATNKDLKRRTHALMKTESKLEDQLARSRQELAEYTENLQRSVTENPNLVTHYQIIRIFSIFDSKLPPGRQDHPHRVRANEQKPGRCLEVAYGARGREEERRQRSVEGKV